MTPEESTAAEAAQAVAFNQETTTEMVKLLAGGALHASLAARIAALEDQYRPIAATIRVEFDFLNMRWGATARVWIEVEGKSVCRTSNHYGGITAAATVNGVEKAFANKFWNVATVDTSCPKCCGLGIECYADPVDRDYHLRACDCPAGIAKKHEVLGDAPAAAMRKDVERFLEDKP